MFAVGKSLITLYIVARKLVVWFKNIVYLFTVHAN